MDFLLWGRTEVCVHISFLIFFLRTAGHLPPHCASLHIIPSLCLSNLISPLKIPPTYIQCKVLSSEPVVSGQLLCLGPQIWAFLDQVPKSGTGPGFSTGCRGSVSLQMGEPFIFNLVPKVRCSWGATTNSSVRDCPVELWKQWREETLQFFFHFWVFLWLEERVVVELIKLGTQSPGKRVAKPEAEHRVPDRGANLAACHIPIGETAPVVEEMHLTVSCTPCLMPHSQECPDGGLAPREGLAQRLRSRSCDGASFPVPGTGHVITNKLKTFKCWCYHFVSNCMEVKNVLCFYQNTVTTGIIGSIG